MSKKAKATDGSAQHARFVETARKLGCDESEEAFDEKLKAIAKRKPAAAESSKASVKAKPETE